MRNSTEFSSLPQNEQRITLLLFSLLFAINSDPLGKGFSFVGNQVRITLDNEHYYPDLVFYNRILRCFVIIDLKIGKVSHQDIGQMQMYVNYYDRNIKQDNENATIGILLSTNKNETIVKYTLPRDNKTIFSSEFKLHMPTEQELIDAVEEEKMNYLSYTKTDNFSSNII